ncbi:cytochrome P450 [Pseudozyma hubeiensis SY62]|uniref:Cytochrome P450 n=1 Tax=Pseudozyma hubeiensis (strain SY62) TaxID=1305764 RepID=R9PG04_PSEHS|nr:cytochrome P450 [Pseudozyma hubeiensis SY62]GAC97035.1 cytochrome P450 [Pseudozyma hubeiensis SY62]
MSSIDHDLTPSAPAQTFAHMQEQSLPLGSGRQHLASTGDSDAKYFTSARAPAAERASFLESGPAPAFSRSSLYQIGMVEGLTPPAHASVSAVGTSPVEVSSVVTAGLEMGLGVSLASSALMTHIPGAKAAALSGLAEPRYSRPHQSPFEPLPTARDAAFELQTSPTTSRLDFDSSPEAASAADSLPYRFARSPERVADGFEGDLHRRRTTGTRQSKARIEPMRLGRHHRADTHDAILSSEPSPAVTAEIAKQQYYQNNYIALRNEAKILTHGLPSSFNMDAPLSAATSLDREPSLGGRSSTHAQASVSGSTQLQTPSLDDKAMLSPDAHYLPSGHPFAAATASSSPFHHPAHHAEAAGWKSIRQGRAANAHGPTQAALLGLGGGSHFGPGVRAKVSEVLPHLVSSIPLSGEEGETITIAEYGSLNTRSVNLMQAIISFFVDKAHANTPRREAGKSQDASDYFPGLDAAGAASLRSILGVDAAVDDPCKVNFSIIHEDSPQADFRPLSQMLDTNPDSYLHPQWQATHEPPLHNAIFPSFVSRPFASRIAPPSTLHLGISLMDLHWSHTPRSSTVSLSTSAHAELAAFLTARAHEFRTGGVIVMAYIARSEDSNVVLPDRPKSTVNTTASSLDSDDASHSPADGAGVEDQAISPRIPMLRKERRRSNSSPNRPSFAGAGNAADALGKPLDIWSTLTSTLAPCLQRLVSCGMLKSDVARHLLSLPMHARTPRQTRNVLKSVKHLWKVEWSCGLGDEPICADTPPSLRCEAEPLRLPHPAWKALQAGTLSRVAFAEHMIQLFKNLYESHFRAILREKGKLSKGAVEFVLDSLWDVLQSRIDDQEPCPIAECELEVQIVALRRI